jgi:ketosteroid isomerase-like protein
VAALLVGLGVEPDGEPAEPAAGADASATRRMAERLHAAYQSGDLDALGGLLHPEVRWGWGPGGCHSREQVLERLRVLRARGVRVQVRGVEVRGDSVVFTLGGSTPGAGLHQVLRIADGAVVEIRGYADQEEALASIGAASS